MVSLILRLYRWTDLRRFIEDKLFGDNENTHNLAEFLLDMYDLEDLLELNDLTEIEVVSYLLEAGLLGEPASVIQEYEDAETEEEE